MTDLNEKWKKGELPEGFYYVKDGENMIAEYLDGYFYNNGQPMTSFSGGVDEVLASVPSYEEWQKILNYAGKYEFEYTSCAMDYENLKEENTKLKELLKKANKFLKDYGFTFDGKDCAEAFKVHTKINQALGEYR